MDVFRNLFTSRLFAWGFKATKEPTLYMEYQRMVELYTADMMTELFERASPRLPAEYHKVWRSYQSRKNRGQADEHTKELMRQKVKRLQEKSVTNYRIYTDLKLNPGNLNAWLKYGDGDKVSLETARRALRYVENMVNWVEPNGRIKRHRSELDYF